MSKKSKQVFLDRDGGLDDLLALLLILTMEDVELIGINITPADCYPDAAAESSLKFLQLMGCPEVEVAVSKARGVNAFPEVWRAQPQIVNAFPQLLNLGSTEDRISDEEGSQLIIRKLKSVNEPISYLMTGPCTTLVHALRTEPALRNKIEEIVWMAGAVHVHGNVRTYTHDGSAEWNVYWDAPASHWLLENNLPLILVPLDATNKVPVGMDFLKRMACQANYDVSQLASLCWAATVNTIPGYDYLYHMWDVLATTYIGKPNLFELKKIELEVSVSLPNEGETIERPGCGNFVRMVTDVHQSAFYDYLLQQSKKNFANK